MKSSMKKLLALFVCVCLLMSGTAYAQESSIDGQETSSLKAQGTETNEEGQKQGEAANLEGQTQKEEPKAQEEQKVQEEQKDEAKAGEKKAKTAKQADALAAVDVAINEANFPDANFRRYVNDFDTDGDGNLSASEISKVTKISAYGVSNLKGIEYFTGLEDLSCGGSQLTSFDVSKNVNLKRLYCTDCKLTSLDVSKNVNLTYLGCANNQLTTLDVSKNVALDSLDCSVNQLSALDFSKNVALRWLECTDNQLSTLNVSENVALTWLCCWNNKLTTLDVSKSVKLDWLSCDNNKLTTLDVSKNVVLYHLTCSGNQLTGLDVRNCTELYTLDVRPLPKSAVRYTKEPDEFYYGEGAAVDVSTKINASEIKAQTSGIDTGAICKAFNIDEGADVEVVVEQKDASLANQRRVMDYAGKYGDRVIKVYEIVMNLYEDGEHKATVTDNFGRLTLSLYAGKEYAGKTVTVYQLHGTSEVIPYRDLTVDENGMVTITVSKLSTFAVALQGSGANTSPKTGDPANMAVWIVLAVLAMSAIPITARRKQKR